jgi:hypothetical protein
VVLAAGHDGHASYGWAGSACRPIEETQILRLSADDQRLIACRNGAAKGKFENWPLTGPQHRASEDRRHLVKRAVLTG